jgi:hypothetical protein
MYPAYNYHLFYTYTVSVRRHAYVSDLCNKNIHCLWYIHIARQREIHPKKFKVI